MGTRAYFMVNVAEKFCQKGYQDVLRELEAIPDVKSVERVGGVCDLFVEVDSPLSRRIFVANKIMANSWIYIRVWPNKVMLCVPLLPLHVLEMQQNCILSR